MHFGKILVAGAILALSALPMNAAHAETLVVGVYPNNPPWEVKTPDGNFEGFEVDVINEVAKRIGMTPELQNYGFQALFSALSSDRIDAAICSITITDERLKSQSFAQSYYDGTMALITSDVDNIKSTKDLRGKTVGAIASTTADTWLKEHMSELGFKDIRTYNGMPDLVMDTQSGRLDGAVADTTALVYSIEKSPTVKIVAQIPTGDQFAIMLKKDSPILTKVNDAISDMKKDGTMAKIYRKWLGSDPDPKSSTVNIRPLPVAK